jgi:GntR family transcriptional regulator
VYHIIRLRLADDLPVMYETRSLAYDLCPHLLENDLETASIHSLLVEKYRIPMVKTVHVIDARSLPPLEAQALQVPAGTAAFFIDRLTYTRQGERIFPAVWYQAYYRGDEYQFRAEFHTHPEASEWGEGGRTEA